MIEDVKWLRKPHSDPSINEKKMDFDRFSKICNDIEVEFTWVYMTRLPLAEHFSHFSQSGGKLHPQTGIHHTCLSG